MVLRCAVCVGVQSHSLSGPGLRPDPLLCSIDMLGFVTQSVKRHGNRSQVYQIEGLLTLVQNSEGVAAEAAARAFGALNQPSPASIQLIIGEPMRLIR